MPAIHGRACLMKTLHMHTHVIVNVDDIYKIWTMLLLVNSPDRSTNYLTTNGQMSPWMHVALVFLLSCVIEDLNLTCNCLEFSIDLLYLSICMHYQRDLLLDENILKFSKITNYLLNDLFSYF